MVTGSNPSTLRPLYKPSWTLCLMFWQPQNAFWTHCRYLISIIIWEKQNFVQIYWEKTAERELVTKWEGQMWRRLEGRRCWEAIWSGSKSPDFVSVEPPCNIIAMSFSNYAQGFVPFPCFYDSNYLPLPYYACLLPDALPAHSLPPPSLPLSPQPPPKQFPWARLEAFLTVLHGESGQHRKTHWTAEEDALLSRLVEVERREWKEIPEFFAGRTQNMCYSRYRRISLSCRDRTWSPSEEEAVVRLVAQCGEKWKLISARLPKFTPKQIRERFLNYLRPHISKGEFSLEEDLAICRYVLQNGKHWRKMEHLLPGRSEGCIKGRYYGKLQKIINDLALSPSP